MEKTIYKIINSNLCIGCGTCTSICPTNSIKLTLDTNKGIYIPALNEQGCINCGLCLETCPSSEGYNSTSETDYFSKNDSEYQLVGEHLNGYMGHSTDFEIRSNSASGGLVTSILIHALETGYITGALVTRMNEKNPLKPEPFIARSKEEIIAASGSKYCPVPLNIELRKILKDGEDEKLAVVGLPCHIAAIKKVEKVNKILRKKIVLHISIFCSGTPNFKATEFLIKKLGQEATEIESLDYRGSGWPGKLTLKLKSKKIKIFPYPDYWKGFGNLFYPTRCKLCIDWFAKDADISLGDAWIKEKKDDKIGESLIIVRNLIGKDIIKEMEDKKIVELSPISTNKIYSSQIGYTRRRKYLTISQNLAKLMGRKPPCDSRSIRLKISLFDYIRYTHFYSMSYIATKPKLWHCITIYCYLLEIGTYLRSNRLEEK